MIKYDLATIGTTTIDTFLDLADICYHQDTKKKTNFYCFPIGGKVPIVNLEEHIGGNAANTAVAFSRLKLKTAIVTSLGRDKNSRHIIEHLQKKKVATNFIKINKLVNANLSYILDWHKDKNDRVILSYHQPKNFRRLAWPPTKWLYLTSLGEDYPEVVRQLPEEPMIAWNPGGWEIKQGATFLLPTLKRTEILIVNQEEASRLLNIANDQTAENYEFLLNNLLKLGIKTAVITVGRAGAYTKTIGSPLVNFVPGLKIEVNEVTGAGDAFAAGFVAGYIKKEKLTECLRWGILNASSCIQKIGAQNGLLSWRELKKSVKLKALHLTV